MDDELIRFLFEGLPVRGALLRLGPAWQELLRRRAASGAHPPGLRELLGEMTAASLLLQAHLRFDGALTLQAWGDGAVKLAVAEVAPDLGFRTAATVVGTVPPGAGLQALLNAHGKGRCAITLDPRKRHPGQQPYQGVVPLPEPGSEDATGPQQVARMLEHYMRRSEQLDTRLVLAADDQVAAGLLVQRVPVQGQGNLQGRGADDDALADAFPRIAMLAGTLARDELLTLAPAQILGRLFHEETLRVHASQRPRFACSCSRQRVGGMLRSLGRAECDELIAERGSVEVGCEFCGLKYRWDAVDIGELFTPPGQQPPGSSAIN